MASPPRKRLLQQTAACAQSSRSRLAHPNQPVPPARRDSLPPVDLVRRASGEIAAGLGRCTPSDLHAGAQAYTMTTGKRQKKDWEHAQAQNRAAIKQGSRMGQQGRGSAPGRKLQGGHIRSALGVPRGFRSSLGLRHASRLRKKSIAWAGKCGTCGGQHSTPQPLGGSVKSLAAQAVKHCSDHAHVQPREGHDVHATKVS